MNLELCSKGVRMTDGLRAYVDTKLRSTLGRFGNRVRSVRVRLKDINGPKGGEDIECHINANLGRAGAIVIRETRCDPFRAVARASDRAGHLLTRQIARTRAARRER